MCLKTAKFATAGYLDTLPTQGNKKGQAFRDYDLEEYLLGEANKVGLGAQFGGKYLALDVKVIRLPRHGGSFPIGMAISCAAHRNIKAKINAKGILLETLEKNPGRLISKRTRGARKHEVVEVDLNQPMKKVLSLLTQYSVGTALSLNGTIVVARDLAHARIKKQFEKGNGLPKYLKNHPIYYAGPAKAPEGMASGSFGPTTSGRMDSYVDLFQSFGGSLIMIGKGNRSKEVTASCKKNGGFYLGSIGGAAALLAKNCIHSAEVIEYQELGMEAVWKIKVSQFPAFILIDDKGNDLYQQILTKETNPKSSKDCL